jgi:hypothetical protein
LTPTGCRGKWETPQAARQEARLTPTGKQSPGAEINKHHIFFNQIEKLPRKYPFLYNLVILNNNQDSFFLLFAN